MVAKPLDIMAYTICMFHTIYNVIVYHLMLRGITILVTTTKEWVSNFSRTSYLEKFPPWSERSQGIATSRRGHKINMLLVPGGVATLVDFVREVTGMVGVTGVVATVQIVLLMYSSHYNIIEIT